MSPTAVQPQPAVKTKREKERERREKAAHQQGTERLKTVVRRLPPNLPEDVFWQTVKPWVTEETVTWKIYHAGKFKKRDNKENIPSRAYIAFKNDETLANFSQGFDGHLFKDKTGNESYAIVEFAPYQKVPAEKRKPDNKNATIEKDEDYVSFIESLNAPTASEPVTIDALLTAKRPPSPPKTTPLLEALKAERTAQKDKEAILRNHAHYKEQTIVTAASSSRKEEKKKAAAIQAAQVQAAKQAAAAAAIPSSKKGKKGPKEPVRAPNAGAPSKAPAIESKGLNSNTAPARPARPPKPAKQPAPANAAPPAPVAIVQAAKPSAAPLKTTANPSGTSTTAPAPSGDAAPPARRRAYLSNRQFAAAMAGVGAPQAQRDKDAGGAVPPQAQSSSANGTATATPSSPVKDKAPANPIPRSRSRRGGASKTGSAPPAHQPPAGPVPVQSTVRVPPVILQREPVPGLIAAAAAPPPQSSDRGGRGGRRGRGRGGRGARGG